MVGQQIGMLACSGDKQAAAVGFDNLVVAGVGAAVADKGAGDKVVDNKAADKVVDDKPVAKLAENKVDDGGAPPDVKPLLPDYLSRAERLSYGRVERRFRLAPRPSPFSFCHPERGL